MDCKFILHKETVIKKKPQWKIVLHPITYYKKHYILNTHAHSVQFYINPQKSAV